MPPPSSPPVPKKMWRTFRKPIGIKSNPWTPASVWASITSLYTSNIKTNLRPKKFASQRPQVFNLAIFSVPSYLLLQMWPTKCLFGEGWTYTENTKYSEPQTIKAVKIMARNCGYLIAAKKKSSPDSKLFLQELVKYVPPKIMLWKLLDMEVAK